jgi:phosphoesterase RecJ-like protein
MIDFILLQKLLNDNNSFLLTTHVNPDADAIGSEIAIYLVLKKLGKSVNIINFSEIPYNLAFLDTDNVIEQYDSSKHDQVINSVDTVICLDFNRADRTVEMKNVLVESSNIKICIDHHQGPESFFKYLFIDTIYSATGEIIYDFIKKSNIVDLSYDIVYPLYAAIMTDTGSFRFERTTPGLHRMIAEMLEFGVVPGEVYNKIYDECKSSKLKLLGRSLNSMQVFGKKQNVGYMVLTQKDFDETSAVESDTDGFVNFALSVENVKIGILFIELKDGFKMSFRSKGTIPVNQLAGDFGGGGHINAAGARFFNKNLYDILLEVLIKASVYADMEVN